MIPLRAAPLSINGLEGKQLRAPTLSGDSCAFNRDFIGRRMQQIAHHLPANRRIGIKQPLAEVRFHVRSEENLTLTFDEVTAGRRRKRLENGAKYHTSSAGLLVGFLPYRFYLRLLARFLLIRLIAFSGLNNSCSQIRITDHPSRRSLFVTRLSLDTLCFTFSSQ